MHRTRTELTDDLVRRVEEAGQDPAYRFALKVVVAFLFTIVEVLIDIRDAVEKK